MDTKSTLNKIIEILDEEVNDDDYDAFEAYGDICSLISRYQEAEIKRLKEEGSEKVPQSETDIRQENQS